MTATLTTTSIPVIAVIGRPNVGKSTLFNYLTRSRDALVADQPGVTRDRQYGFVRRGKRSYVVVDTGGLSDDEAGIDPLIVQQAEQALQEADVVLFVVDGRAGMNAGDAAVAEKLRRLAKPTFLAVNKTDGVDADLAASEFYTLGVGTVATISSAHGHGIMSLLGEINELFPFHEASGEDRHPGTRVALVGRPNVGKSTLVNRLVGEERVVAFDKPGTTRDSIEVPFERDGKPYVFIDTAGVRRRARVDEGVEKFSVVKTLQAIEAAEVVVMLLDARDSITDQDLHLLGHIYRAGRALVIAVNKWDGMHPDERERVKSELERKLTFIDFADTHFISALHGTGVGHLFGSIDTAMQSAFTDLATPRLTQILEDALGEHSPPLVRGRRIKLRYAHQGGNNPPIIVIHGNQTQHMPATYKRYLANTYRKVLGLRGTPIRIELRTSDNPYKDRKNKLTPRQERQRKRMLRHVKKKR